MLPCGFSGKAILDVLRVTGVVSSLNIGTMWRRVEVHDCNM